MVSKVNRIITRQEVQANKDTLYVFGDNIIRRGYGGQAREMRGESNAIGIVTKKYPNNHPDSFLSDDYEYATSCANIMQDVKKVIEEYKTGKYKNVVIPPLGVGLAQLPTRAPKTYEFLLSELKRLEDEINSIDSSIKKQANGDEQKNVSS